MWPNSYGLGLGLGLKGPGLCLGLIGPGLGLGLEGPGLGLGLFLESFIDDFLASSSNSCKIINSKQ